MKYSNTYKTLLLFICILSSLIAAASVQTIHFDIMLFGSKIGVMTVTREVKPDSVEVYTLDTKSRARILWIDKVNLVHYDIQFKNGKLVSSAHRELENGKVKRWTNVTASGDHYDVDSYKGKRTFKDVPVNDLVTIYFHNIGNVKRIFYEAEADYAEMQHPEPDTYEFKSSDGTRNIYNFQNGQIKNLEFHVSLATVKMVRTD